MGVASGTGEIGVPTTRCLGLGKVFLRVAGSLGYGLIPLGVLAIPIIAKGL
jgi:hypothetical protein